jgi:hypothetical protein
MFVTVNIPDSKPHTRMLLLNSKRIERHTKCRTCPSIIFIRSLTNVAHLENITVFWCADASTIILSSIQIVPSVHLPIYCGCYLLRIYKTAALKLSSHCVSTNFVYLALTFSLLQHYVTTSRFWKRHTRHFHAAGSGSYNTVLASYRHVKTCWI